MSLLKCFAESFRADVSVDLRCGNAFVTKHFLDAHDFCAIFQQMGGEAVAKNVWAGLALPTDGAEQVVDVVSQSSYAEWFAVVA